MNKRLLGLSVVFASVSILASVTSFAPMAQAQAACAITTPQASAFTQLIQSAPNLDQQIFVTFMTGFSNGCITTPQASAFTGLVRSSPHIDQQVFVDFLTSFTSGNTTTTTTAPTVTNTIGGGGQTYSIGDTVVWRANVTNAPIDSRVCTILIRQSDQYRFAFPPDRPECVIVPNPSAEIPLMGTLIPNSRGNLTQGVYKLETRLIAGVNSADGKDPISYALFTSGSFNIISQTTTSAPTISSVSPTSGPTGTTITIHGTQFTDRGNTILMDYTTNSSSWYELAGDFASNGTSITLTLPSQYPCPTYAYLAVGCPYPSAITGTHTLRVKNSRGISNAVSFTVNPVVPTP